MFKIHVKIDLKNKFKTNQLNKLLKQTVQKIYWTKTNISSL